jgi:CDP-2,3-bis-(O-geranylgeranyl)-sn-glycerol synthase
MSVVIFIEALKFIFPAYCANAIPVIAGGGFPIDFRKNFLDGRPIFGKNKTIRGFFFGLVSGTLVGIAESLFFENYPLYFGFILSLGALTGDLLGAFLKRRIGLKPGDLLPVVDQVDFILGAIIFSLFFYVSMVSSELVVAVLIITPPLHLLTNYIAYKTGLKSTPW